MSLTGDLRDVNIFDLLGYIAQNNKKGILDITISENREFSFLIEGGDFLFFAEKLIHMHLLKYLVSLGIVNESDKKKLLDEFLQKQDIYENLYTFLRQKEIITEKVLETIFLHTTIEHLCFINSTSLGSFEYIPDDLADYQDILVRINIYNVVLECLINLGKEKAQTEQISPNIKYSLKVDILDKPIFANATFDWEEWRLLACINGGTTLGQIVNSFPDMDIFTIHNNLVKFESLGLIQRVGEILPSETITDVSLPSAQEKVIAKKESIPGMPTAELPVNLDRYSSTSQFIELLLWSNNHQAIKELLQSLCGKKVKEVTIADTHYFRSFLRFFKSDNLVLVGTLPVDQDLSLRLYGITNPQYLANQNPHFFEGVFGNIVIYDQRIKKPACNGHNILQRFRKEFGIPCVVLVNTKSPSQPHGELLKQRIEKYYGDVPLVYYGENIKGSFKDAILMLSKNYEATV